jgi:transmembrane sensor
MNRRQQIDLAAEQAAQWVVQFQEDHSEASKLEFWEWARQSPLHIKEFLAASEELERLGMLVQLPAGKKLDVARLLDLNATNVVSMDDSAPVPARRGARLNVWTGGAIACGMAVLALVLSMAVGDPWSKTYTTSVGDQRTVKLPDGSVIHLNADSELAVRYSDAHRKIRLARGEALFTVAHDASRPFDVDAGSGVIRALGTQFNVYRRDHGATVSVVEGTVQISSVLATTPVIANAGDQVEVPESEPIIRQTIPVEVEQALAWRERRLKFRDRSLQDVAKEFNRYNTRQIIVPDVRAQQKLLNGVFDADQPEALVKFLKLDPMLSVEKSDDGFVVRSR